MKKKEAVIKHYLDHENGGVFRQVKSEGENWLNLLYGLFFEPQEEIRTITGHTGVCFEVDGNFICVKNYSKDMTTVRLERNGNSQVVPILQMRVLQPGDNIHIDCDHPWLGIATRMSLKYRQEVVDSEIIKWIREG